jgi:hypothetical protein
MIHLSDVEFAALLCLDDLVRADVFDSGPLRIITKALRCRYADLVNRDRIGVTTSHSPFFQGFLFPNSRDTTPFPNPM